MGCSRRVDCLLPTILLAAASLIILAGCSTERKQRWLKVFFDGVPEPGARTNAPAIVYDENGQPLDRTPAVQAPSAPVVKVKFYSHPPYDDKQCNECHESRFSVKMKGPQRQVCFACHEDFLAKAKVKHQPAENSECSSCHDPHGSSIAKMLVQTGPALCLKCHDAFPPGAKSSHLPADNGECLSCHNPHASDQKGLLIKPVGKLCFDCHDDLGQALAKAPFKHDPAGNGDCASCHAAHQSKESNLLIKNPAQLCYECHEQKDLAAVKAHAAALKQACLECHDPHLGQDKNLLKPAFTKLHPAIPTAPAPAPSPDKPGGAK